MALVLADRVKETTTTTGTGTVTLAGTSTGFQSFSAVGNGNTTYYTIVGGSEWEVGLGTYTSSGTTLSRSTVLASSNSGSLVNFSAGSKDVFVTYPAEKSVNLDGSGNVVVAGSETAASFIPSGSTVPTNGMYLSAANTLDFATNSTLRVEVGATGVVAIGGASTASVSFWNRKTITGSANAVANSSGGQIQSDATGTVRIYESVPTTTGAVFTVSELNHYLVNPGSFGSTTVTTQVGLKIGSTLTGAGTNYGIQSEIAAAANRYNLFINGTAQNALAGLTRFGATTAPVNTVDITGSLGRGAPVTKTTDFTLAATENWVISDRAATNTVTLPAASSWTGREVMFKTIQAQTLVSASSNVVPLVGGAAGTAILAATAGKWATAVSDGTNWVIMQGN